MRRRIQLEYACTPTRQSLLNITEPYSFGRSARLHYRFRQAELQKLRERVNSLDMLTFKHIKIVARSNGNHRRGYWLLLLYRESSNFLRNSSLLVTHSRRYKTVEFIPRRDYAVNENYRISV